VSYLRGRKSSPKTIGIVSFHPQRGGMVTIDPVPRSCRRYRGGKDSDWREIARVEVVMSGRAPLVVAGQSLPKGYLWGAVEKQVFGMGGGHAVYGPLENRCSDCGAAFVLSARAQQHMYEVLRLHVDTQGKRCLTCGRKRRALEEARVAYAAAVTAAEGATTAKPFLDLARTTLEVVLAGGKARIERGIASCRRARKLGAGEIADRTEARLERLRAG
jgi:hypothetical protein